ncbi:MAG: SDR family NAD(P)-dependent oxidoreductase [Henriciella sp.]
MTDQSEPLFLFGPGYSATALSMLWQGPVYGTVRSEQGRVRLADTRIEPISIDDHPSILERLDAAHLLISAPPSETGCPALAMLGDQAKRAASVTYLSTTGVYGDLDGGWAMEWSAINPQSDRAERRVLAEQGWHKAHKRVRMVRLPGIYGPGRSALERVKAGKARRIVKTGQVFSRVHVDDIASGLHALLRSSAFGAFNLCDDYAAPPQDVIALAADLLGVAPPPEIKFEDADLSPMGRSFYSECKRVSNARIKAATGWRPQYPTYQAGLSAIASDMA